MLTCWVWILNMSKIAVSSVPVILSHLSSRLRREIRLLPTTLLTQFLHDEVTVIKMKLHLLFQFHY